ncbi:MAG: adenosylcobinamide-phosphate synthase CbiB [Proteobacteria bacterium]|nr:adenosylcobinamide-phosphate synthase CbiB [Pseudomonadota bacterium]MBU1716024.1 adenosylcobinamide-phosphate synthase CbiB [Pseudomonadota bacterium]
MGLEFQIIAAFLLDQLIGDPPFLPHPVRMMGRLAIFLENICRKLSTNEKTAGVLTTFLVLIICGLTAWALLDAAGRLHPLAYEVAVIYLLYTTIATRDLVRHSKKVYLSLTNHDLPQARRDVAMIVGRDTAQLDEQGVARAAVESVAESMVDGVTAPLFYALLGGPIAALIYKAINTGDSMFGYKNEKYHNFGWAPARLDDLANFIPARITGLLVPVAALITRLDWQESWRILRRDRLNHASPNSAHPEAAIAGALNIQLGGRNYYFGQPVNKPSIGDPHTMVTSRQIILANRLMMITVIIFLTIFSGIGMLIRG